MKIRIKFHALYFNDIARYNMMYSLVVLAGLVFLIFGDMVPDDDGVYKQQILDVHNNYRRKQGASNMNKLVWDDQLEKEAGDWAQGCKFEHQIKGRGENLAYQTYTTYPDYTKFLNAAMKSWYDEINMYSYAGKDCRSSCHYTQMVWANTKRVGCAMKLCPASKFGLNNPSWMIWYFVCFYDPMGNYIGQYPYLKGTTCSKCEVGQSCDNGLCSVSGDGSFGNGSGSGGNGDGSNGGSGGDSGDDGSGGDNTKVTKKCKRKSL